MIKNETNDYKKLLNNKVVTIEPAITNGFGEF